MERPLIFVGHSFGGIVIEQVRYPVASSFSYTDTLTPKRPLIWLMAALRPYMSRIPL